MPGPLSEVMETSDPIIAHITFQSLLLRAADFHRN
jgi:hypothetical protein